jgi:hypothetical protein
MDLYKAMEVFASAKTRRADFGQLDHGLQFESYLKLIKKSNCWLLQMEKGV